MRRPGKGGPGGTRHHAHTCAGWARLSPRPGHGSGWRELLALALALWFCANGSAISAETDVRDLELRIESLQEAVGVLKRRIDELEKRNAEAPAMARSGPAVAPHAVSAEAAHLRATSPDSLDQSSAARDSRNPVELREHWRRVSAAMNQQGVRDTLGPPTRELTINGKAVWYYTYAGIGAGSIFFNSDGRVSSKQVPAIGWD